LNRKIRVSKGIWTKDSECSYGSRCHVHSCILHKANDTSIAALQCVERGQIGLDNDVSDILAELREAQILTGFDEGTEKPILKNARDTITLRWVYLYKQVHYANENLDRQLLSHSSGLGYDGAHPDLARWRMLRGQNSGTKGLPIIERINMPLTFEPGTGWLYGTGLDWAGLLVARLNHTSLEAYMQQYIWDVVGSKHITFHQELKPLVKRNLVTLSKRGGIENPIYVPAVASEKPVEWTDELIYDDPTKDEYGGAGAIGSATEYMKIMRSILVNDGRLLMPSTVEEMFKPQLKEGSQKALAAFLELPFRKDSFTSLPTGTKVDHGLGGLLILDDLHTGLKKGTLTWSGLPNLLWTIDRKSGLALLYASSVVPFGDFQSAQYQQLFETEMYSRYKARN
jgi:CubicO group peptidase (beta-lactamase class C family)